MNKAKISLVTGATFLVLAALMIEDQDALDKKMPATPYLEKIKKTLSYDDENILNPFSTNYAKRTSSQEQLIDNNLPYKPLKQLFDQFVMESNINQKPIDFRKFEKEVASIVDPKKTGLAMNLFKKYLGYLDEIKEMDRLESTAVQSGESFLEGIQKNQEKIYHLRSKMFSPEQHTQLFGDEEIFDKTSLAIAKISEDTKLSEKQKKEEIKLLKSTLPLNMRNTNSEFLMAIDIKVNQIVANGGSNDDVYRYRANVMNPEAAARFAELDREEEHWKQKIANYAQAKQNILQFNLNESEIKSAINTLRSLHFNDIERKRLIAYEN